MEQKRNYTFDLLKRHLTKGIAEKLPKSMVLKLWEILDDFLVIEMPKDYLQVFDVKVGKNTIAVLHFQEQPAYSKTHVLGPEVLTEFKKLNDQNEFKIYVIDDISHSTMLFAEEY